MLPSLKAHPQLWAGGRRFLSAVKCTPNDKMYFLSNSRRLAAPRTWLHVLKPKRPPPPPNSTLRVSYSLSLICQPDIRADMKPHIIMRITFTASTAHCWCNHLCQQHFRFSVENNWLTRTDCSTGVMVQLGIQKLYLFVNFIHLFTRWA